MNYEQFLFTRNKRRDFTAFVRPTDMTNKEVSILASAFNTITDVAALTSGQPGLYCFPLGAYMFVLRFYDSGRKHAGREIAVIEGIAVRADEATALIELLPEIVDQQLEWLDVVASEADLEDAEVRKSEMLSLAITSSPEETEADSLTPASIEDELIGELNLEEETNQPPTDDLLVDVAARLANEQLVLTFDDRGRNLLIDTLMIVSTKPLHFAFGTNNDVIGRLAESGVDFDVVGLFGASEATFRVRAARKQVPAKIVAPVALAPLVEPEPIAPTPIKREHHSLLGKLVGWLLGR